MLPFAGATEGGGVALNFSCALTNCVMPVCCDQGKGVRMVKHPVPCNRARSDSCP